MGDYFRDVRLCNRTRYGVPSVDGVVWNTVVSVTQWNKVLNG